MWLVVLLCRVLCVVRWGVVYNLYTLLEFGWRDYSIEPPQKYTTQFLCDYSTIAGP